jgi:chloramphenicol 3-O-phosphotransferase
VARPTLVYLYGPPASGKLTIAERLAERTGFRLFHNHLTVNALVPVFDFGSKPFADVLHRLRLDAFATAARHGIDVIFTNNSAWRGADGNERFRAFAEQARRDVAAAGGRAVFVRVTAPDAVLEERLANESRRAHGKLLDVTRLRELLAELDQSPLHAGDLTIDTSTTTPDDAAARIAAVVGG